MKAFLTVGITLLFCTSVWAQDTKPLVVMNLAAHPDDEDGRTLTYYRHAKNAVAYSVIYTRGEGGQNEIGPELYDTLGAIRTDETERAARILGTQVFFLNFKDFGYSKKASEAFEFWGGKDHVTARLVYLVRKLKPDVMFTNHDTLTVGPRVQHGQHQAVGISAYEAFHKAADPTYHPEQLEEPGVDLWQPSRLFLRLWRRTTEPYDVRVPVTDIDIATGNPHTDRAAIALAEHESQGMGKFITARRMREDTHFITLASAISSPPDSLDLAGNLNPNTRATPLLTYAIDSGRTKSADDAITLSTDIVNPGNAFTLSVNPAILAGSDATLSLSGAVDTTFTLRSNATKPPFFQVAVSKSAISTLPAVVQQYARYENHPPIQYKLTTGPDKTVYAGHLDLDIAPPFVAASQADVVRLKTGTTLIPVETTVYNADLSELTYEVQMKGEMEAERTLIASGTLTSLSPGTEQHSLELKLDSPPAAGDYTLTVHFKDPENNVSSAFDVQARSFDVEVPAGLRVGVIESYDNTLAQALEELGVSYALLDSLSLANRAYEGFNTILIDIRAYLVRQDLRTHNEGLLEWVENGGHLIVNYHKTMEWNTSSRDVFVGEVDNPQFAPYPLLLSRDRVTREDAPVTILNPDMLVYRWPNQIDDSIWEDWVQERGLYFPREYGEKYQELFSMSDPGEDPLRSSTLLAEYGDGTYLYTALGWYRQLKNYNPGVYAFFANMISMPMVQEGPMIP